MKIVGIWKEYQRKKKEVCLFIGNIIGLAGLFAPNLAPRKGKKGTKRKQRNVTMEKVTVKMFGASGLLALNLARNKGRRVTK